MNQQAGRDDHSRMLNVGEKAWVDAAAEARRAATERFNNRRDLEWKLALALWAGLLLAANALGGLDLHSVWKWALTVGLLVFVVLHFWWESKFVVRGAMRDRNDGIAIDRLIREALGLPPTTESDYLKGVAHYWPVLVSALLGFVVAAVLWAR